MKVGSRVSDFPSIIRFLLDDLFTLKQKGRGRGRGRRELFADKELNMDVNRKVSEEEIEEYLVKKAIKKANKLTSRSSSSFSSFYSNQSNPFGDSNLDEKFVWRKKIERDIAQGLTFFSLEAERRRQRERMEEIEKVKKRREQRALEKRQHEEERELLARERARAEFQDWQKKEGCAIPQFVANDDERKIRFKNLWNQNRLHYWRSSI